MTRCVRVADAAVPATETGVVGTNPENGRHVDGRRVGAGMTIPMRTTNRSDRVGDHARSMTMTAMMMGRRDAGDAASDNGWPDRSTTMAIQCPRTTGRPGVLGLTKTTKMVRGEAAVRVADATHPRNPKTRDPDAVGPGGMKMTTRRPHVDAVANDPMRMTPGPKTRIPNSRSAASAAA